MLRPRRHLSTAALLAPRDPAEVELGRIVTAVLAVLERDMDEVFTSLVHTAGADTDGPVFHAAHAANRVVLACRYLAQQLRLYEDTRWWIEDDLADHDDDVDF